MKFGVLLPHVGRAASGPALEQVATRARELGCTSVWVGDHVCFPDVQESRYPYNDDGDYPVPADRDFFEAFSSLAYVASMSGSMALGVSVVIAPYRPAPLLAKTIGTLEALNAGPVILGVGAGWLREEFDALGVPFEGRHRRTDDVIRFVRGAMGSDGLVGASADGAEGPKIHVHPAPSTDLKIWIGGAGPMARRRAGRLGDAWHPTITGKSPATIASEMEEVREHAEAAGRAGSVGVTMFIPVRLEDQPDDVAPWERGEVRGPAEHICRVVDDYEQVGVDHVILSIGGGAQRRVDVIDAVLGCT